MSPKSVGVRSLGWVTWLSWVGLGRVGVPFYQRKHRDPRTQISPLDSELPLRTASHTSWPLRSEWRQVLILPSLHSVWGTKLGLGRLGAQKSLSSLNTRLPQPLPIDRFRPKYGLWDPAIWGREGGATWVFTVTWHARVSASWWEDARRLQRTGGKSSGSALTAGASSEV